MLIGEVVLVTRFKNLNRLMARDSRSQFSEVDNQIEPGYAIICSQTGDMGHVNVNRVTYDVYQGIPYKELCVVLKSLGFQIMYSERFGAYKDILSAWANVDTGAIAVVETYHSSTKYTKIEVFIPVGSLVDVFDNKSDISHYAIGSVAGTNFVAFDIAKCNAYAPLHKVLSMSNNAPNWGYEVPDLVCMSNKAGLAAIYRRLTDNLDRVSSEPERYGSRLVEKPHKRLVYNLTFFDVMKNIFNDTGWYQGENFADGVFITVEDGAVVVKRFTPKGLVTLNPLIITTGVTKMKYRECHTQPEIERRI